MVKLRATLFFVVIVPLATTIFYRVFFVIWYFMCCWLQIGNPLCVTNNENCLWLNFENIFSNFIASSTRTQIWSYANKSGRFSRNSACKTHFKMKLKMNLLISFKYFPDVSGICLACYRGRSDFCCNFDRLCTSEAYQLSHKIHFQSHKPILKKKNLDQWMTEFYVKL